MSWVKKTVAGIVGIVLMSLVMGSVKTATFDAMMIHASNDPAPMDRRLERVEFQLRRIFGFQYYRHIGEGKAAIVLPGEMTMDLGHDYRLKINAREKDNDIRAEVTWYRGEESVLNTTVKMKRGAHAILGGIPHEKGTLIITLVWH